MRCLLGGVVFVILLCIMLVRYLLTMVVCMCFIFVLTVCCSWCWVCVEVFVDVCGGC